MVLRTKRDTSGDPYKRVHAMNITCGICDQNVEASRPSNFIIVNEKCFHRTCVEKLKGHLGEEDTVKLDEK